MFGQKFTNTNEMLQYRILHYAEFAPAKLAQLNTAIERKGVFTSWKVGEKLL
jgi:hypothetical protein